MGTRQIRLYALMTLVSVNIINAEVIVYPALLGAKLKNSFTVEVRQDSKVWRKVPIYEVMVRQNARQARLAQDIRHNESIHR